MQKDDDQGITLRDIITHIQAVRSDMRDMGQRLQNDMKNMEQRLSKKIDANTDAITVLTQRVDALEEDLTATIMDTMKIRQHVGLSVAAEE